MAEDQLGEKVAATFDWPFDWPERLEADMIDGLLAANVKPSSYERQIMWSMDNLDNIRVRADSAPCSAAWSMLKRAVMGGEKSKQAFMKEIYREFMKKADVDSKDKDNEELIEAFTLIDRFERLKDCPHCGKEL